MDLTVEKPLSHITVVDLTVNVPGPFCSTILGDLGANVIKIEPPGGDPLRHSPSIWDSINRGKDSIVLNLKKHEAQKILFELVSNSDIVLEGWRPGVANRLKADYKTLSRGKENLVYCSISGFGQDGPWKERSGHDVNYLALSGYMDLQTQVEGRPWPPPVLFSDLTSGLYAAISTLAAIIGRTGTGKGSYIDLSMTESALSLLTLEFGNLGNSSPGIKHPNVTFIPHYGLFECSDKRWISLGIVHEDHFWNRFCAVANLPKLKYMKFEERLKEAYKIQEQLSKTFMKRTADDWEQDLVEADVPAASVTSLGDILESPQFKARGIFTSLEGNMFLGQPAKFSTYEVSPQKPPPKLGQDTKYILSKLGYDEENFNELNRKEIFS